MNDTETETDYKALYEALKPQLDQQEKIYNDLRADLERVKLERDTAIKERNEANELYLQSGTKKPEKNNIYGDLK